MLITPKQTQRKNRQADQCHQLQMDGTPVRSPQAARFISLPTALFFKLYLFCSTVYTRSTCGIQAVGTTVIIHIRVSEDLAIAYVDQKTSLLSCQETDRK